MAENGNPKVNNSEPNGGTGGLVPVDDSEAIQAIVLAAAINGNPQIRQRLPLLTATLDEPYRTVAAVLKATIAAGKYIDRHTLALALTHIPLARQADGRSSTLTSAQVMSLIFASDVQPGQAEAYLQVLEEQLRWKRQAEVKESAKALASSYGDQPDRLLEEIRKLAADARRGDVGPADQPTELAELIPFVEDLVARQQGSEFLGLDSGFAHLNAICNGLDTGLIALAAPPGFGKTTWAWQVACQAAQLNQLPAIFVSMEQSKSELRAKALARLSKLQYRHILRGRLRADDANHIQALLEAAIRYGVIGQHLTVVEGDENTTIDAIQQVAMGKLAAAGATRCLIVIDYLQILPIRSEDADRVTSPKDRVDLHVSALRRLARSLNSPVLAISAENRAGYTSKQLNVFKESGGIEYSADIALILSRDRHPPAGQEDYRTMDLNVVKNRNGERGVVKYKFYAKRAEFVETAREPLVEEEEQT